MSVTTVTIYVSNWGRRAHDSLFFVYDTIFVDKTNNKWRSVYRRIKEKKGRQYGRNETKEDRPHLIRNSTRITTIIEGKTQWALGRGVMYTTNYAGYREIFVCRELKLVAMDREKSKRIFRRSTNQPIA